MELQKEGWAFGDGGVKNDEDLNMQKRSQREQCVQRHRGMNIKGNVGECSVGT